MSRILVTGAAGFVGRHMVAEAGARPRTEVFALVHHHSSPTRDDAPSLNPDHVFAGDLTERAFADAVLHEVRPDRVVHLAAQSSVPASWRDPERTLVNNLVAELNLLESMVEHVPDARILVVGSSEEYGSVRDEDLPLAEAAPLRPNSPYAVSKIGQDFLGFQYFLSRSLAVVRVRPFNLIGPGQSDRFAISSFARQIAEAEAGKRPPVIEVGNLNARRDYTDVRDGVRAYALALELGRPGDVYNVGGGSVHSVQEMLDALRQLSRCELEVRVDPARFRPADTPVVESDCRKLREETGWIPRISIEQTLRDVLDEWRRKVAQY